MLYYIVLIYYVHCHIQVFQKNNTKTAPVHSANCCTTDNSVSTYEQNMTFDNESTNLPSSSVHPETSTNVQKVMEERWRRRINEAETSGEKSQQQKYIGQQGNLIRPRIKETSFSVSSDEINAIATANQKISTNLNIAAPNANSCKPKKPHGLKSSERARVNLLKTLILISACFFLCQSWNQIYFMLAFFGVNINFNGSFYHFTVIAIFTNSCINPLIYTIKYQKFKQGFKRLVAKTKSIKSLFC